MVVAAMVSVEGQSKNDKRALCRVQVRSQPHASKLSRAGGCFDAAFSDLWQEAFPGTISLDRRLRRLEEERRCKWYACAFTTMSVQVHSEGR